MVVDAADKPTISRPRHILGRIQFELTEGSLFPLLMLLPALAVLALVVGVPILKALHLSFDTIILTRPRLAGTYGFHNYVKLATDPAAWAAVARSCLYMTGTVLGCIAVGLAAALLTRRIVRFSGLARTAFILPWAMPAVVAALIWGVMYEANFGVINELLVTLPFVDQKIEWLLDRRYVLPALIVAQVWNEFPVAYVFFLAGLQAIPEELYEAASVDRASAFQKFRYITLPQLRYIMAVIVVLLLIFGFKSFPIIFILTGGGPAGRTETLTVLTYNTAFRSFNFSYSATLGILAVVISILLVLVYMRLTIRRGIDGGASS